MIAGAELHTMRTKFFIYLSCVLKWKDQRILYLKVDTCSTSALLLLCSVVRTGHSRDVAYEAHSNLVSS